MRTCDESNKLMLSGYFFAGVYKYGRGTPFIEAPLDLRGDLSVQLFWLVTMPPEPCPGVKAASWPETSCADTIAPSENLSLPV
jgi:hypothetical protein